MRATADGIAETYTQLVLPGSESMCIERLVYIDLHWVTSCKPNHIFFIDDVNHILIFMKNNVNQKTKLLINYVNKKSHVF